MIIKITEKNLKKKIGYLILNLFYFLTMNQFKREKKACFQDIIVRMILKFLSNRKQVNRTTTKIVN